MIQIYNPDGGIESVVEDTSPQLGGDLDLNTNDITGTGDISITGEVEATTLIGNMRGATIFQAKAGEALTKGDPVYISGDDIVGNKPIVSIADSDDANKMPCFGLAAETVSINANVNVVTFGTITGLDTSSFSQGDILYISTTGTLTATKPSGESSLIQNIGKVMRSHASTGSIKVGGAGRTNDVPNLNDGNVFIGNASNQAETRALTLDDISETVDKKIFTDTEQTKLAGIESGATADQTPSEIKTAYESNANTNAFTDSEKTKLAGIATGAEVNVNADWNAVSGDAQILNKPSDVTDLSMHNVTELADVTSAGSGAIITSSERTKVGHLTVTGPVDLDNIDASTLQGRDLGEIFEKMRSKYMISGGGQITWSGGVMSWTTRIIIIPVGQVPSTYFNIQPSSITIGSWNVAYIRPSDADWNSGGSTNQTVNTAGWTSYTPQFNDIVIAHRNGDNNQLVLMDGRFIDDGHVYNCSGEQTQKGPVGIGTNPPDFLLQVGDNAVNTYYNSGYKDSPLGIPLTFEHSWGTDHAWLAKANAYFFSNSSVASGKDMAGAISFGGINSYGGYNTIYARMGGRRLGNFYGGFVFQTMHNVNDGRLYIDMVIQDGKVGIGTSSPSYKLHVNGEIMSENWIRVRGTQGFYCQSYGGGWNMQDTTYMRCYGNKIIYTGNDIRGNRFVDNQNTGRYVDASGTSELGNLVIDTELKIRRTGFRSGSHIAMHYYQYAYPGPGGDYNTVHGALEFRAPQGWDSNDLVLTLKSQGYGNNYAEVNGNLSVSGSVSKGSGSFDIPHPNPAKKDTHRLRHYFVETPSAGGNIYKYQLECNEGDNYIDLPDYFEHLNENSLVWANPFKHFGRAWGEVIDGGRKAKIVVEQSGIYNILIFGDRKDDIAMQEFEKYGIEYEIKEQKK